MSKQMDTRPRPQNEPEELKIVAREYHPKYDLGFVFDSFFRSQHYLKPKGMPDALFFGDLKRQLNAAINQPNTKLLLAVPENDPEFLCGWICVGEQQNLPVVYYAYFKSAFRRMGLCKLLLQQAGIDTEGALRTIITEGSIQKRAQNPILTTARTWFNDAINNQYELMVVPSLSPE